MDIKILVATHKPYWKPDQDIYVPIWVGAAKDAQNMKATLYRDDTGDHISCKNPYFCELTALYWAWKNLQYDYLGLVHYRRYFGKHKIGNRYHRIADRNIIQTTLEHTPVILPCKRHYWIDTNYGQYVHAHHEQDLIQTRRIISDKYPEYLSAYDAIMKKTSGHRFNMFIMRKDIVNQYCTWLFDILFGLEQQLDISQYSRNDQRVFGFVAERLIDCWIETNHIRYRELPVVNLESQHWLRKGTSFLLRRFSARQSLNSN